MSIPNNNRKRIAVFHNLPPGGGLRFIEELICSLKSTYLVDIYVPNHRVLGNFGQQYLKILFEIPKIHKEIARLIDSKKYDVVLVNHDYLTKAPYILKYLKTKSLYICHEEPREFYDDKKYLSTKLKYKFVNLLRMPLKYIDKKNAKYADLIIANSIFSKNKLEKIYSKNIFQIDPGVNTDIFRPLVKNSKGNYYLTVGSLSRFKGIDFIIKSISLLPENIKLPLVVVGNFGRDNKEMHLLARKLKVKLIHKKNVNDKELIKLYSGANLLLAAAINEPFGLSLLEALSCGTQVVAVDEGGYVEIVKDSKLGELVIRDEHLFSRAIKKRVNLRVDKNYLHTFVKQHWNWNNTARQLETIITKELT